MQPTTVAVVGHRCSGSLLDPIASFGFVGFVLTCYPLKSSCSPSCAPSSAASPSAPAPALPADGPAGSNRSVWRRPALAGSAPGPLPSPAPAPPAHRQAGLPDCSQHAPQSAVPASRTATPDRRPHRRQCRVGLRRIALAVHIRRQRLRRLRQGCPLGQLPAHRLVGLGELQ